MAKIYRVIQIKLNQLVSENVHMITDLPTKRFTRCHSDTFLRVLPTTWRQKINWHRYGTKMRHCHRM